jgi:hypothetical protein
MTATRRALFNMHSGTCVYCRRKTELPSLVGPAHDLTATVEHVIPVSRGGAMRGTNVTLACHLCNGLKGDMTPHQWAEYMMDHPEWWIRSKKTRASERRFARRQPLPIAESQMILREGKKAWKKWKAARVSAAALEAMTAEENARRMEAYLGTRTLGQGT